MEERHSNMNNQSEKWNWFWRGSDFLCRFNNLMTKNGIMKDPKRAYDLIKWYISPSYSSYWRQVMQKENKEDVDLLFKQNFSQLHHFFPEFIAERQFITQRQTFFQSAMPYVLRPSEAGFPFHWLLFRALAAEIEEWEERYQAMITPFLIISSNDFFVTTDGKEKLGADTGQEIVQKALGHSFWNACYEHELSMLTSSQHHVLHQAIALYFTQYDSLTKLPSVKDVARAVGCHVNQAYRTLTFALKSGVVDFHSFPRATELGVRLIATVVRAPPVLPYLLTIKADLTDVSSAHSLNKSVGIPSMADANSRLPFQELHAHVIIPLGTRTWLIIWSLSPSLSSSLTINDVPSLIDAFLQVHLGRGSHVLEEVQQITSVTRWLSLNKYFNVPMNQPAGLNAANMMEDRLSTEVIGWNWGCSMSREPNVENDESSSSRRVIHRILTPLQATLIYHSQHSFIHVRGMAKRLDVEPSTILRNLVKLKSLRLLLPDVSIRFVRPVRPVLIHLRGCGITNLQWLLRRYIFPVKSILSGIAWQVNGSVIEEKEGEEEVVITGRRPHDEQMVENDAVFILASVSSGSPSSQRELREVIQRLVLGLDLDEEAVIVRDFIGGGSLPIVNPLIPNPIFLLDPSTSLKLQTMTSRKLSEDVMSAERISLPISP